MPSHLLVRPIGQSPDGESWTFGTRFCTAITGSPVVASPELQAIAERLAELNSNKFLPDFFLSMISAALHVRGVRVEYIGNDGKLAAAGEELYGTPVPGTGTANRTIQTAVVVSLNRGAQFGRSGRGRVYIPSLAAPAMNGTTLRILGTGNADVTTTFNQYQADIRAVIDDVTNFGDGWKTCVYSPTKNQLRLVENVSTGDVFDTQRRRRDRLVEARAGATISD